VRARYMYSGARGSRNQGEFPLIALPGLRQGCNLSLMPTVCLDFFLTIRATSNILCYWNGGAYIQLVILQCAHEVFFFLNMRALKSAELTTFPSFCGLAATRVTCPCGLCGFFLLIIFIGYAYSF
jgi:hypothetical protein